MHTVVGNGGEQHVQASGTATTTIINNGGTQSVDGTSISAVVN
ncbi:AIDA repeat-containing protein, partial [Cronobacter malonaticus]